MAGHYLPPAASRRDFLKAASCGFGYLAFSGLSTLASARYDNPLSPKTPHFPGAAKRVIFMCMRGGPSHVDTFDYKPALAKYEGNTLDRFPGRKLMPSPWKFTQHGESGLPISDLLPHIGKHADDMCIINSMHGDVPAHPQAYVQLHTGSFQFVRPSVGSWILHGLGTENENLPGFITISPPTRVGGAQNYGSSFLPAVYQGTPIGQLGKKLEDARVGNLSNPRLPAGMQRKQIDLVQSMNQEILARNKVDPQIEGVIESYELAFRMQSTVPELMDIEDEPKHIRDMYGIDRPATDDFGRQCLLARRFAEAGVRYIELSHSSWDQHNNLRSRLESNCRNIDQPMAALITDLKQRGMLNETLLVWGGEFGRTPHARREDGRDHNATGFSFWMAGGGVKGGLRYGKTDENGVDAVENKVHIHDLHATILHTLGLDHKKLTYNYSGRDFRLTDVYGNIVHDILA